MEHSLVLSHVMEKVVMEKVVKDETMIMGIIRASQCSFHCFFKTKNKTWYGIDMIPIFT